jgi:hypothetical protein
MSFGAATATRAGQRMICHKVVRVAAKQSEIEKKKKKPLAIDR